MKNVLLIQIDGKMDNLALMKIARYHFNQGNYIEVIKRPKIKNTSLLDAYRFDTVYISCIFKENMDITMKYYNMFKNTDIHIGGTGIDIKSSLPNDIEHLMPYYDLFGCDVSMGFTSRGCIRNCGFCIVPEKEGIVHPVSDIYEFWDTRHDKIVIMDNNILALSEHFEKIANQIKKENLFVEFNSGLDIRLINDKNAEILSGLRRKRYTFAWDNIHDEQKVLDGIEILKNHKIKESRFYVIVGYNSTWEEDMYRFQKLKELNQLAYCMRYEAVKNDSNYAMLASWVNMPWAFFKYNFDEFLNRKRAKDYVPKRI